MRLIWLIQQFSPFSQLSTHPINKQNAYYHLENTENLCQRTGHRLAQQLWSCGLSMWTPFSHPTKKDHIQTKGRQSQFHGTLYGDHVSHLI